MALKDIDTCIAAYDFSSAGFSSGQLIDGSGFGNNMNIVGAAAPSFVTRSGHEMTDFDNSYYYEGFSLLGVNNSVIMVAETDVTSVVYRILGTASKKANDGNFSAVPYDNGANEFLSNTYRGKGIMIYSNSMRLDDPSSTSAQVSITKGAPLVFTGAVDLEANSLKASVNEAPFVQTAFPNNVGIGRNGAFMRIGFLRDANEALPAGKYISIKEMYFFKGNVFDHPDFASERAAAVAAL